jgi:uncharacterized protein (PEP-CTERM system associated)
MSETALSPKIRYIPALTGICVIWFTSSAIAENWTITPRVTGQELYTDNVLLTATNRRSDFVTTLSPGIAVNGESPRLQARLDYSPTVQLYALTPDLNFIGQNLYANGTATVVPELFFLDARGLLSMQPTLPGLGTALTATSVPSLLGPSFVNASQGIPKSQLAQVSSFSASPYLARRFDGVGTAELRYSFSDTNTDINGTQGLGLLTPAGTAPQNASQTTNEATAVFVTGENLGRMQSRVLLDAAQSSGIGANQGNQLIGTIDSAYAVTERIAALATIGHEQLNFGGLPRTHIDGLVWGLGTKLTPNPDSTIVVSYGRRNGVTAPYASLLYNITARTTLSASYTAGLSTVNQEIANNLAVSDINQAGQTLDVRTALPLLISNPTLGLPSGLFRNKQFAASLHTDFERDHITLSFNRAEMMLVAQSTPGSGVSESSLQANIEWSRELNPRTTATLGFGYANIDFAAPANTINFAAPANTQETIFTSNVSVTYLFTPSLTGWASYNFLNRTSPQPQFQLTSNVVTIGLRKEF